MSEIKKYNVAVVGATGAVGEAILAILAERHFPVNELFVLASNRSAGSSVVFANRNYMVQDIAEFDFSQADIALFSAGSEVSRQFAPKAAKANCIVIDNTSEFRYEKDVPLVVPEVNPLAIGDYEKRYIIANPNCSTIQLLVVLKPLYEAVGITRINIATYQSVSGAGRAGIKELAGQTAALLNGQAVKAKQFSSQIAFNAIPHIDVFQANGYTREEMKIVWETQKILDDPTILVNPTAVRVPVFYGHSEAVHIETREKLTAAEAREILRTAPGVCVLDDPERHEYPTAVSQAAAKDAVYVGRIREDISHETGLDLWIVADNIRKGAALNAIQIAEYLVEHYL